MRYLRGIFGWNRDRDRVEVLESALKRQRGSVELLKAKVDKLIQSNSVLRNENARLASKVALLYERNKIYAERIRQHR